MPETITPAKLREADVLLYHGTSWVSKAIRLFDGTDVSHAALCLGKDGVAEAIGEGLVRRGLQESIQDATYLWVRRLKSSDEMAPVLAASRKYLDQGSRYAYEQIVLLALLALTRKVKVTPILRHLLRGILDRAAAVLSNLGDHGKEVLICSEFVYRAYDEALPGNDDVYSIHVSTVRALGRDLGSMPKGQGVHPESVLAWAASPASRSWAEGNGPTRSMRPSPSEEELPALFRQYEEEVQDPFGTTRAIAAPISDRELLDSIDRFAEQFERVAGEGERAPQSREGQAASRLLGAVADFVTPGDLLKTESMLTIGRLPGGAREREMAATNGRVVIRHKEAGPISRALIVGINRYQDPRATLKGCVNDALMMGEMAARYGFERDNIRLITDGRATTRNIRERLSWLVEDVPPGSVILFHYSGHGSQIRDRDGDELEDHLDEILCPHDLDWSDPITDDELGRYIARVPQSVNLTVVLDCCHSGTGTREFFVEPTVRPAPVMRYLAPPPDLSFRFASEVRLDPCAGSERTVNLTGRRVFFGNRELKAQAKRISQNAFVISGCRDDQTSADAWIDNDYHGALTYSLYHNLQRASFKRGYQDLVTDCRTWLKERTYTQEPQLSAPDITPLCDFLQPFAFRPVDAPGDGGDVNTQGKGAPRTSPPRPKAGLGTC